MYNNLKIALGFLVFGLVIIVSLFFVNEDQKETSLINESQLAYSKGTIKIGVSRSLPNAILCGDRLKQLMLVENYTLSCDVIDKDQSRFGKLFDRDAPFDFATGTVISYLKNGTRSNYGGIAIMVLSQNKTENEFGFLEVDALIASGKTLSDKAETAEALLRNYFKVVDEYKKNRHFYHHDISAWLVVDEQELSAMVNDIDFKTGAENLFGWMGVDTKSDLQWARYGLIMTIEERLKHINHNSYEPIRLDPRRIVNKAIIEQALLHSDYLHQAGLTSFPPISDHEWANLISIKLLTHYDIVFWPGSDELTDQVKMGIDELMVKVDAYPYMRLQIEGHSGPIGNEGDNKTLSLNRARAVSEYIITKYNLPEARVRPVGFGSDHGLERRKHEPFELYNRRLARVEIRLMNEIY